MNIKYIDFILSHSEEPLFPRKMMTAISNGQFSITSKDEILKKCKQAHFIDFRINAYPEYVDYKGIVRYPPNFISIDLDLALFLKYKDPKRILENVLKNILRKVNEYGGNPTFLWAGNGYHVYQPIHAMILDHYEQFSKDKFPILFFRMANIQIGLFLKFFKNLQKNIL